MELTNQHLAELVIFEHYSRKFQHARVGSISDAMQDLIELGWMKLERDSPNITMFLLSVTDAGREAIADIGYAAIVCALGEQSAWHLIPLCVDKLTLEDLPGLFASQDERVRELALAKYEELTDGTNQKAC